MSRAPRPGRAGSSPTTRSRPRFAQWKQYRGGTVSRIWIYDPVGRELVKIPQPETRSNDTDAMWVGNMIYFRSDRNGEFNLFSFDPRSKAVRQLTRYNDFPILSASAGGGRIVFEQAGYLHLFDPGERAKHAAEDRRRGRFAGDAAAVRERRAMDSQRRAVADRRSRGVRVPRRDRHRAGRERRRAQPDADARLRTSGRRPGRRMACRSRTSPTRAANTRCASRVRTARASRARSSSTATASTTSSPGRPTARSCRTSDNSQSLYLDGRRDRQVDAHRRPSRLHAGRAAGARLVA